MTWGLVAVAGATLVGSVISSSGAKSAANTQANAQMNAAQIGQNEFNTITKQESPFMQAGYGATSKLTDLLGTSGNTGAAGYGSLTDPFTIDKFHQMSPAYQFALQQGGQGTLNGASPNGSVLGGAAQKELMRYNQQFANTSFNDAFNQYQSQQGNIYSRLANIAQLGQNAAANTGQQGTALAGSIGQSVASAGAAQAAGQVGAANAWSQGLSNLGGLYAAYGGGGGGGGGSSVSGWGTPLSASALPSNMSMSDYNAALNGAP